MDPSHNIIIMTRLESSMLHNLLIMLFSISPIFWLLCSFLCLLGMHYADNLFTFLHKMIMIGSKCGQLQYKSFIKCIKIDVSASICSNFNSYLKLSFQEILNCIVRWKIYCRFVHSMLSYSLFGIPNRSAFDFMFVLAEIFYKFPLLIWKFLILCWHYALCFPAPIMLKIMLA